MLSLNRRFPPFDSLSIWLLIACIACMVLSGYGGMTRKGLPQSSSAQNSNGNADEDSPSSETPSPTPSLPDSDSGSDNSSMPVKDPVKDPIKDPVPDPNPNPQLPACNYYASPTGGGNGLAQSSPFRIVDFWRVAGPGRTLCLLNGVYRGPDSMIVPTRTLSGNASARITVRALNDGQVTIDGEGARAPVSLGDNNFFALQGFNAKKSSSHVVSIVRSRYVEVKRVVAWDANINGNSKVFQVADSQNILLEDCAGFGSARKIFEIYGGSVRNANSEMYGHVTRTTLRRCWARWEGSNIIGPKLTYSISYNSSGNTAENVIGTWSGELMNGRSVNQPYAIFGGDRLDQGGLADDRVLGSIAYLRSSDAYPGRGLFWHRMPGFTLENNASYVQPGSHSQTRTFQLDSSINNRIARNLTSIGGAGPLIDSSVQSANIEQGPGVSMVSNIYTGSGGATICKRYVNRTLTSTPLWPWPMDQRIYDALRDAGKTAFYVTDTIENMFGRIPAECRGAGR